MKHRDICGIGHNEKAIYGIGGGETKEEASQSIQNSGEIEIPNPTYGYLRTSQLEHERTDRNLRDDWVEGDLEMLLYVDRLVGNRSDLAFMCKVEGFACRYRMKYTR